MDGLIHAALEAEASVEVVFSLFLRFIFSYIFKSAIKYKISGNIKSGETC